MRASQLLRLAKVCTHQEGQLQPPQVRLWHEGEVGTCASDAGNLFESGPLREAGANNGHSKQWDDAAYQS